jgi:hypothetical protein
MELHPTLKVVYSYVYPGSKPTPEQASRILTTMYDFHLVSNLANHIFAPIIYISSEKEIEGLTQDLLQPISKKDPLSVSSGTGINSGEMLTVIRYTSVPGSSMPSEKMTFSVK